MSTKDNNPDLQEVAARLEQAMIRHTDLETYAKRVEVFTKEVAESLVKDHLRRLGVEPGQTAIGPIAASAAILTAVQSVLEPLVPPDLLKSMTEGWFDLSKEDDDNLREALDSVDDPSELLSAVYIGGQEVEQALEHVERLKEAGVVVMLFHSGKPGTDSIIATVVDRGWVDKRLIFPIDSKESYAELMSEPEKFQNFLLTNISALPANVQESILNALPTGACN
jgi:hypothetical protein